MNKDMEIFQIMLGILLIFASVMLVLGVGVAGYSMTHAETMAELRIYRQTCRVIK